MRKPDLKENVQGSRKWLDRAKHWQSLDFLQFK